MTFTDFDKTAVYSKLRSSSLVRKFIILAG